MVIQARAQRVGRSRGISHHVGGHDDVTVGVAVRVAVGRLSDPLIPIVVNRALNGTPRCSLNGCEMTVFVLPTYQPDLICRD